VPNSPKEYHLVDLLHRRLEHVMRHAPLVSRAGITSALRLRSDPKRKPRRERPRQGFADLLQRAKEGVRPANAAGRKAFLLLTSSHHGIEFTVLTVEGTPFESLSVAPPWCSPGRGSRLTMRTCADRPRCVFTGDGHRPIERLLRHPEAGTAGRNHALVVRDQPRPVWSYIPATS
jgi:hypothetical protein